MLATNIAETSITINDVVFVIDCGKAKETSYDALNNTPCLLPSWISKVSAQQVSPLTLILLTHCICWFSKDHVKLNTIFCMVYIEKNMHSVNNMLWWVWRCNAGQSGVSSSCYRQEKKLLKIQILALEEGKTHMPSFGEGKERYGQKKNLS